MLATFGSPEVTASPFHAEIAAPLVARLKSLLEADDGEAIDAIQPVTDALAGVVAAEALASLRNSVNELDFGAALAKLGEIAAELKLSLNEPPARMPTGRS